MKHAPCGYFVVFAPSRRVFGVAARAVVHAAELSPAWRSLAQCWPRVGLGLRVGCAAPPRELQLGERGRWPAWAPRERRGGRGVVGVVCSPLSTTPPRTGS